MCRRKRLCGNVHDSIVEIVKAVCADYDRRQRLLNRNAVEGEVLQRYQYLNRKIELALEHVEVGIRKDILEDIRERRGYDFSQASPYISRNAYYQRKKQLIYDIAVNLSLV